jgi:hypothetical protein
MDSLQPHIAQKLVENQELLTSNGLSRLLVVEKAGKEGVFLGLSRIFAPTISPLVWEAERPRLAFILDTNLI